MKLGRGSYHPTGPAFEVDPALRKNPDPRGRGGPIVRFRPDKRGERVAPIAPGPMIVITASEIRALDPGKGKADPHGRYNTHVNDPAFHASPDDIREYKYLKGGPR